jgi:hypothetical protein
MGPVSFPNFSCKREVSMAINVEVSELVENFQWLTEEQSYALDLAHKDQQDNLFKGFGGYMTPQKISLARC